MIRCVLITLALCGVACGGTVLGGSTDGGSDAATDAANEGGGPDSTGPDGGSVDAGKSWSPFCPENEPVVGSACSVPDPRDSPGLWCEYGKIQYDVSCDTVYQCQAGLWTKNNPLAESTCQPDGPNAPSCPATYGDLQAIAGGACVSNGLRCEYPQGVCTCARSFGGPIEPDGGTTWFCNPGADCPMPRPRLGASCSGLAQTCQYLTCEFGEACVDGNWEGLLEGCAEPGGSP